MNRRKKNYDARRGTAPESRLKMPQAGEVVGKVFKVAGASKFFVRCTDGKERVCAIPGRLRRAFWIKENDVVIVKPWVVQTDERGDIVWRYSLLDISKLKEMGLLNDL